MAYCAVSDVQDILAGRKIVFRDPPISPATTPVATVPSLTQVTNYIANITDEINETITRQGYQAPITANAYLLLTTAMGAGYLVEMALAVDGKPETMAILTHRQKEYKDRLASIEKNPRLIGAIPGEGTQNNYITSDGVANYTQNSNADTPFQRDSRNW